MDSTTRYRVIVDDNGAQRIKEWVGLDRVQTYMQITDANFMLVDLTEEESVFLMLSIGVEAFDQ